MTDPDRMVSEWRRMTEEEITQLVRMLQTLPPRAGFSLTKVIDVTGAPLMIGAYTARVFLDGGGSGQADDDNPARALRAAWGLAHLHMAEILRPPTAKPADSSCKRDWCWVYPTPDADYDPSRRFKICTKCHVINNQPRGGSDADTEQTGS